MEEDNRIGPKHEALDGPIVKVPSKRAKQKQKWTKQKQYSKCKTHRMRGLARGASAFASAQCIPNAHDQKKRKKEGPKRMASIYGAGSRCRPVQCSVVLRKSRKENQSINRT